MLAPLPAASKRSASMLCWLLLTLALTFLALGTLTVFQAPAWSAWQLAVLAGEFGHWLAPAALILGVAAVQWSGAHVATGRITGVVSVAAAVLLLRPSFQAWRIASILPAQLAGLGGETQVQRRPFSFLRLLTWSNPPPAPVRTFNVSDALPIDFYGATSLIPGQAVPCVIVVHGGGWDSGDRSQIPRFNDWLAERGFAVAAISYRLAPRFVWPAQRDDLLAAIAFLKTRAGELGIDPMRFVVLGRSAGGQIALTTAYTVDDPAIRGVIALYSPSDLIFGYVNTHEHDMLKSPALMRQYLGGPPERARANYESASALFHVTARTPPTLLLHGENDALVWHRHSVRLAARLTEAGVPHAFLSLPWATHAFDYNLRGPGGQLTTYAVEQFLRAVTRQPGGAL